MSINDFKQGAKAVAEPINIKLKEMEEQLNEGIKDVKAGVKMNSAVNQQLISILEEQDERVQDIENFQRFSLSSKESINCLNDTERRVLLGIAYDFMQKFEGNILQQQYFLQVAKCLRIVEFETVDVECIENVDSMKTQAIMFNVMQELAFLANCSVAHSEEIEDFFANFMLNNKKRQEIIDNIESFYQNFGEHAFIQKYESVEVDFQKSKYQPLELNISLPNYSCGFDMGQLGYDGYRVAEQHFGNVHKKYASGFDPLIKKALTPWYEKVKNTFSSNDEHYFGKEVARVYSNKINGYVGAIQDFLETVPELNIEIQGLNEMKEKSYETILNYVETESYNHSTSRYLMDFDSYVLSIKPSEDSRLVDSLFGGLKSVTDYSITSLELLDFEFEINQAYRKDVENIVYYVNNLVEENYIKRLKQIVELINNRLLK